ncbi:GAF domain-containing protein [Petrocella sp. FN5]|uniref:GAF domain-containing protein n=1 Tax=Petrocella sp. FN5 TaxID=3032002 RepID=UPI0023DAC3AF|nr:GAF domain-containing protein [Petrocella sp. FN5]MDF1617065.1 GAF domain-containing protein [Petrocella sp. FN5]
MFDLSSICSKDYANFYADIKDFADGLFYDERDALANMSNLASLLYHTLGDVNWVGYYLFKSGELVLGPFQGKPACVRISIGKGVCGTAAMKRETLRIPDVHQFEGHIACDGDTKAELVIPMIKKGVLLGVLDIDSTSKSRFSEEDQKALENIVDKLLVASDFVLKL